MKPALALVPLIVLVLGGCAQSVALEPAANASDKACAEIIVDIAQNGPKLIDDLEWRETNAQGTAAWGTPSGVILRCGVAVPGPTSSLPCVPVEGIDWLADGSKAPTEVFTTYGRSPAIEVIVDRDAVLSIEALTALAPSIGLVEAERGCTEVTETL